LDPKIEKLVRGYDFLEIFDSASKNIRRLISVGLQAAIKCGTFKGVELILEHSLQRKIHC
jgi:hypothetical protein